MANPGTRFVELGGRRKRGSPPPTVLSCEDMQVEILLDAPIAEAIALMAPEGEGKRVLSLSRLIRRPKLKHEIKTTNEVQFQSYLIRELESGTIELERDGIPVSPVLPVLKEIAQQLSIPILNSNGNPFNTRQLGSLIIKSIAELQPAQPAHVTTEILSPVEPSNDS